MSVTAIPEVPDECQSLVQSLRKVERESFISKKLKGDRLCFVTRETRCSDRNVLLRMPKDNVPKTGNIYGKPRTQGSKSSKSVSKAQQDRPNEVNDSSKRSDTIPIQFRAFRVIPDDPVQCKRSNYDSRSKTSDSIRFNTIQL